MAHEKITIIKKTNIVEILGDERVRSVTLDKPHENSQRLALDGVFVAIGHIPQSALALGVGVKLNEKGEIVINRYAETAVPGVYAAGDVADTEFKQMITGCAEGVLAAYKAFNYIEKDKITPYL